MEEFIPKPRQFKNNMYQLLIKQNNKWLVNSEYDKLLSAITAKNYLDRNGSLTKIQFKKIAQTSLLTNVM